MVATISLLASVAGCYGAVPSAADAPLADAVDAIDPGPDGLDTALDAPNDVADAAPEIDGADVDVTDADAGPDGLENDVVPDVPVVSPCDKDQVGITATVVVPVGETLFFDGDDYLAFWGANHPCTVALGPKPSDALTLIEGTHPRQRLTLDRPGLWEIYRGPDTVTLDVRADALNPDTFLNYNYSPTAPLALTKGYLWVASPVSNALHRARVSGKKAVPDADLIHTGSWPTALAYADDLDYLIVAQTGRDTLGFVDLGTLRVRDGFRVGNEPTGLALDTSPAGTRVVWVALSGEDRVVRVELEDEGAISASVDVGRDPRAMVLDDANRKLYVASLISSNAHPLGPLQGDLPAAEASKDVAVIDADAGELVAYVPDVGTIIRGMALDPVHPNRLIVSVSHSDNTLASVDASKHPITHGLAIVDIDATSPTAWTVIQHIDLDHQESSSGPAASPFSIAATPDKSVLLITLSAGGALLMLDPDTYEELGRIPTGSDPRGLVFSGGRVYTYSWLDNLLESWDLPTSTPAADLGHATYAIGSDPTPLEVKQGQRIFNDASFSSRGEFSCNNCHIDGLTDGLVWDILADGPVNTLAFRNIGGTSPFLWGGQLPTLFDFSREVLKLVGAEASGAQMSLLTLYMQSVTAPPNPYTLPGGRLDEAGLAGRDVFQKPVADGGAGCAECHSGPLLTDRLVHEGKTAGKMTDVPSLYGAYDTGPWGREGQWLTLEAMVEFAAQFTESTLDEAQLSALTEYVRQQPSETLYLTSSTPLADSAHVWFESPVELGFSDVLATGQESAFLLYTRTDAEDPDTESVVDGVWTVSGRFARFAPAAPLALDTHYGIRVEGTLTARFGSTLALPLEIAFETGGLPSLDVSGQWDLTISVKAFNAGITVTLSLIQSAGGQVTAVVVENFDGVTIDHLEGVVDGDIFAIDPFIVLWGAIPIPVADGVIVQMADTDGDGYGDEGTGKTAATVNGTTYNADFTFKRKALPQGAGR
ncbi:MAG: hypothetical protein R3F39_05605 [Myxococcota bacterium]